MKDSLGILAALVGILVALAASVSALLALIVLLAWPFGSHSCAIYGGQTGRQTKYVAYSADCYVKTSRGWFLRNQINQNSVEGVSNDR